MTREDMNEIQENASQFIVGLFSLSSLVLKVLSLIDNIKARKKNEKNSRMVEEKET